VDVVNGPPGSLADGLLPAFVGRFDHVMVIWSAEVGPKALFVPSSAVDVPW
jgi:hypothetical protein